jgi:hypothetical protein
MELRFLSFLIIFVVTVIVRRAKPRQIVLEDPEPEESLIEDIPLPESEFSDNNMILDVPESLPEIFFKKTKA